MNKALAELMARREQLIAQAATQRASLAQEISQLRRPLAIADQGLNLLRIAIKHPAKIASGIVLLMVVKRRFKPMHAISRGKKLMRVAWFVYQSLNTMRIRHQQTQK